MDAAIAVILAIALLVLAIDQRSAALGVGSEPAQGAP
jgi:hypothetical protein